MKWTFTICSDWDIIWSSTYQKQWKDILEQSPETHVFFHPALVKAWVKTYLPLRDFIPIFVRGKSDDNEVFFPLILWKKNWKHAFLRTIAPVGYSDFDYHDPIFLKFIHASQVNEFWCELKNIISKEYIFDEWIIDGLHQKYVPKEAKILSEELCYYLNLDPFNDICDFNKSRNASFRKKIKRAHRMLDEDGIFSRTIFQANDYQKAINILPEVLMHHSRRWPNAYKAPYFHKNILEEGLPAGIVSFTQLNLNEKPFSWRLDFIFNGKYYAYMPVLDVDYQKYSPGRLHHLFSIEQSITSRITVFDHLRGGESYKEEFANKYEIIQNIELQNSRFVTFLKKGLMKVRRIFLK